jgi:hypothetical protein
MEQNVAYIFLDTNTLLHFKRPDNIDWVSLLKATSVVLVITPIVVKELELQKVQNHSRKLRERAQSVLTWLAPLVEPEGPAEIRSNVRLLVIRTSSAIDFTAHHLSHVVSDDELIASALEFQKERNTHVLLVSADLGLRMKLSAHKLKGLAPLESDRLPEELDEVEKELAQLRRELVRHQSRLPKLELSFRNKQDFSQIEMEESAEHFPAIPSMPLIGYDNQKRAEVLSKYFQELTVYQSEISLFFACELLLENNGTSEATNIVIDFETPSFVSARALDNLPKPPKPPRSLFDPLDFGDIASLPSLMRPRDPGKPYISRDGAVSFEIPSLVHNRSLILHRFYFRFSNQDTIQSFSVPFVITCPEVIDPIEHRLSFIASKNNQGD